MVDEPETYKPRQWWQKLAGNILVCYTLPGFVQIYKGVKTMSVQVIRYNSYICRETIDRHCSKAGITTSIKGLKFRSSKPLPLTDDSKMESIVLAFINLKNATTICESAKKALDRNHGNALFIYHITQAAFEEAKKKFIATGRQNHIRDCRIYSDDLDGDSFRSSEKGKKAKPLESSNTIES